MMTNSIQKVTLPDTYLNFDVLLLPAQHFPLGSSNLLLNKVQSCNHLCHGVLDLHDHAALCDRQTLIKNSSNRRDAACAH